MVWLLVPGWAEGSFPPHASVHGLAPGGNRLFPPFSLSFSLPLSSPALPSHPIPILSAMEKNMIGLDYISIDPVEQSVVCWWVGACNGTPLQYSCLETPMDGGAWWAAVHGVAKSRARLSDFTFTFHFHALEKEMAIHSSVLAWRIPGTGSLVRCHLWGHTESDTTEAT